MKFTKWNNPNKRRWTVKRQVSNAQYEQAYNQLCAALANAETESEKEMLYKAFDVTVHPYRKSGF